ncbi:MAG: DUF4825 domain-containing protein [Clostridia bacterium]|nr:DUF4825 domain-containing protein [Clostridia bacterium]
MEKKIPCEVIRDLLPSYADGLTDKVTDCIIKEHINECEGCAGALERMKDSSVSPVDGESKKAVNFFKKTHRRSVMAVVLGVFVTVALAVVGLSVKTFIIGQPIDGKLVDCWVGVDGNVVNVNADAIDSNLNLSAVDFEYDSGVVTVTFKSVMKPGAYESIFESYEAQGEVKRVCVDSTVVWDNGVEISQYTSDVFNTRHPYVGAMDQNEKTAVALNMHKAIGSFKNELQTSQEPYGWTVFFDNDIPASELEVKERYMKSYAYAVLAVIENLGSLSYEYTVDGEMRTLTVTAAQASEFAGEDIKEVGRQASSLQKLIDKADIGPREY